MPDFKLANSLAAEALKQWGAGSLERAADLYAGAISAAGDGVAYFHSALAGVLQQLGRHGEALQQYQKALAAELGQGQSESAPGVKVARHFLAEHLTTQGDPEAALDVLAPALSALPDDWLLATSQARALFAAGRLGQARTAALQALSNARSDAKRAELTEHLSAILAASPG